MRVTELLESENPDDEFGGGKHQVSDVERMTKLHDRLHYDLQRSTIRRAQPIDSVSTRSRKGSWIHLAPWRSAMIVHHHEKVSSKLEQLKSITAELLQVNHEELDDKDHQLYAKWVKETDWKLTSAVMTLKNVFPKVFKLFDLTNLKKGDFNQHEMTFSRAQDTTRYLVLGISKTDGSALCLKDIPYTESTHPTSNDVVEIRETVDLYLQLEKLSYEMGIQR